MSISISGSDSSADPQAYFLTVLNERSPAIAAVAAKLLPTENISKFEFDESGNYTLTLKREVSGTLKHPEKVANDATVTYARIITGRMSLNKLTFDAGKISAKKWLMSSGLREVESHGDNEFILTKFEFLSKHVDYATDYETAMTNIRVDMKK